MTSDGHDHKHCLEMFEKLSEYIDGELDQLTRDDIEKHINNCVACFSCVETLKKTVAICKEVKEKPIPEEFSQKLRDIIQSLPKSSAT